MKKYYKNIFFILFIIFLIIFPLITNTLFFSWRSSITIGDSKTWIGFFGSYYGAILGGVISGMLTLQGVRLAIKLENDRNYNDSLPEKLMFIEDILFILKRQKALFDKEMELYDSSSSRNPSFRERIKFVIKYLDDGLLEKSSKINIYSYRAVRNLYDYYKELSYDHRPVPLPYKKIIQAITECIMVLETQHNKFLNDIRKIR